MIVQEIQRVVERNPAAEALCWGAGEWTYGELWARAGDISAKLTKAGVESETLVAMHLGRSADFIATLLGIWRCGAQALICDPDWPEERLTLILHEACPSVIVCPKWLQCLKNGESLAAGHSEAAYVIYTSGSTGRPKGVRVGHRGLVSMVKAQIAAFQLSSTSRAFWMHGVAFDASISDIGTVLLSGACLCYAEQKPATPQDLMVWLNRLSITHVDLPPAWLPYLETEAVPTSLTNIIIGGEVPSPQAVRDWSRRLRVTVVYGPTEATVCSSLMLCGPTWDAARIGQPLPGVHYRVSDEGELWISGDQVALGYPWAPELHAQRFVDGGRTYRTGDLVRQIGDQDWEFLGRMDRQFKLQGRLICPEEIEAVLRLLPSVCRCCVLEFENVLTAAVESSDVDVIEKAKSTIQARLPSWMLPQRWLVLQLTVGKLDESKIRQLLAKQPSSVPSRDPQQVLLSHVAEILGRPVSSISPTADFFDELGGSSLSAVAVLSLANRSGLPIAADAVYRHRTIEAIVASLAFSADESRTVAELRPWVAFEAPHLPATLPGGDVLLTGATGFLGGGVLGAWLDLRNEHVICLSRRGDRETISAGLKAHGYSHWSESDRWSVCQGDISQDMFGLPEDAYNALALRCGIVVHLAADVRLFATLEMLAATQIHGTARLLKFAMTARAKEFHYASTLAVFVDAEPLPAVCLEADDRRSVDKVYGGYAQSKWVAEQMVLLAAEHGVKVWNHRLGLLTAHSTTGHTPSQDWLRMAGVGDEVGGIDVTPVDYAAVAMALLSMAESGTYHLANPHAISCCQLLPRPGEFAGLQHHPTLRLFKTTGTRFDVSKAVAALESAGHAFPEISDEYLFRSIS